RRSWVKKKAFRRKLMSSRRRAPSSDQHPRPTGPSTANVNKSRSGLKNDGVRSMDRTGGRLEANNHGGARIAASSATRQRALVSSAPRLGAQDDWLATNRKMWLTLALSTLN